RAVHEQHGTASSALPALAQIAMPPKLPAITANLFLLLKAYQYLQAAMDDGPLGLEPGEPCSAPQKSRVEVDVRSHLPAMMCIDLRDHTPSTQGNFRRRRGWRRTGCDRAARKRARARAARHACRAR